MCRLFLDKVHASHHRDHKSKDVKLANHHEVSVAVQGILPIFLGPVDCVENVNQSGHNQKHLHTKDALIHVVPLKEPSILKLVEKAVFVYTADQKKCLKVRNYFSSELTQKRVFFHALFASVNREFGLTAILYRDKYRVEFLLPRRVRAKRREHVSRKHS